MSTRSAATGGGGLEHIARAWRPLLLPLIVALALISCQNGPPGQAEGDAAGSGPVLVRTWADARVTDGSVLAPDGSVLCRLPEWQVQTVRLWAEAQQLMVVGVGEATVLLNASDGCLFVACAGPDDPAQRWIFYFDKLHASNKGFQAGVVTANGSRVFADDLNGDNVLDRSTMAKQTPAGMLEAVDLGLDGHYDVLARPGEELETIKRDKKQGQAHTIDDPVSAR